MRGIPTRDELLAVRWCRLNGSVDECASWEARISEMKAIEAELGIKAVRRVWDTWDWRDKKFKPRAKNVKKK